MTHKSAEAPASGVLIAVAVLVALGLVLLVLRPTRHTGPEEEAVDAPEAHVPPHRRALEAEHSGGPGRGTTGGIPLQPRAIAPGEDSRRAAYLPPRGSAARFPGEGVRHTPEWAVHKAPVPLEEGPAIVVASRLQPTPMATVSRPLPPERPRSSALEYGGTAPSEPAASTPNDVPQPIIVSVPALTMDTTNLEYTHEHENGEIQLSVNATLSTQVDLEQRPVQVSLLARGQFGGDEWPRVEVRLGDTLVGSVTVDSDVEQEYVVPIDDFDFPPTDDATPVVSLPLKVSFINDWVRPETGEDRNVMIRQVSITEEAP